MIARDANMQKPERIHVSSLGSFVFCPRAGVIAFKSQPGSELEDEPRVANLGFLPIFDEDALEEKFKELLPGLKELGIMIFISCFVIGLIARFGSFSLAVVLCLAMSFVVYVAIRDGLTAISILVELAKYKQAKKTPLNPALNTELPISWWGLIKLGYKPKKGGSIVDEKLELSGNPWRVLSSQDGERIPVIGIAGDRLEIKDSHRIKLAAYSYLFELQQHANSDWGIVLQYDTRQGIAVPIGALLRDRAIQHLEEFRTVLEDHQFKKNIAIPPAAACQNCPFGKPRIYSLNESETSYPGLGTIGAKTEKGKDDRLVHSTCGDEFHWVPPHKYWD